MSLVIPEDYDRVSFRQAESLVDANEPDGFETNLQFFEGDHWQGGEGWPQSIDPEANGAEYIQRLIKEMFESKNVIGEVVERFLDGLLENSPEVSITPPTDEDEEPAEELLDRATQIETRINRWTERRKFMEEVRDAVKYAALGGRGYLRPFVPPGRRDEQGRLTGSWDEIFRDLYVEAVKPSNAVIYTHPRTQRKLSVFHFVPGETTEIDDPNRDIDKERVELGWIDPDTGETVMRILHEGESPEALRENDPEGDGPTLEERELRLDLQEHLLLQEVEIDQLITEQVRSSQKSLNMTKTMLSHNEVNAGFNERMFLNAQPPGKFEKNAHGERKFVQNDLPRGPFRTHFIQGTTTTDEMGQEQLATPSVVIDEPDDPEVYIKGKASKRKDILDEVDQTFVLMNESTEISGRSRLIARHEFTKSLNKAVEEVTELIRGGIMSITVMAETFGKGGPSIGELRLPIEVYPDSGPLTPEEMSALESMTEAGLMSMQTALSRAGINDIEAEKQRIREEEESRVQRLIQRAKLIKQLVAAGASLPGAAQVAGFDEEEAQKLQTGFDGALAQSIQETTGNGNPR